MLVDQLLPRWGERPVTSITPAEVAAMRDELLKAGLKPRTVVRHLTVAHGVFKYAVREHGLMRNPASAEMVDRPTVRYSGEFVTFRGARAGRARPRRRRRAGRGALPGRGVDGAAAGRAARVALA